MAKAVFSYYGIPLAPTDPYPQGRIAYRPLVSVTITVLNGRQARVLVVPDSGSDFCLLSLNTAIDLKLDVLKLPQSKTAGLGTQSSITYHDTVTIDTGQGIVFSAYVGFTAGLDATGFGLLGQGGFFEHYVVEFHHRQKLFTIEKS